MFPERTSAPFLVLPDTVDIPGAYVQPTAEIIPHTTHAPHITHETRDYIVTVGDEAQTIRAFSYSQAKYWGRKFLAWRGVAVRDANSGKYLPCRVCVAERKRPGRRPGKAAA